MTPLEEPLLVASWAIKTNAQQFRMTSCSDLALKKEFDSHVNEIALRRRALNESLDATFIQEALASS